MRTVRRNDDPPDYGDIPCELCGQMEDYCICPPCPECGEAADPRCYKEHGMVRTPEQIKSLADKEQEWADSNAAEHAYWAKVAEEEKTDAEQIKALLPNPQPGDTKEMKTEKCECCGFEFDPANLKPYGYDWTRICDWCRDDAKTDAAIAEAAPAMYALLCDIVKHGECFCTDCVASKAACDWCRAKEILNGIDPALTPPRAGRIGGEK